MLVSRIPGQQEVRTAPFHIGDNKKRFPFGVWTRGAGSQQMEAARSLVFVGAVLLGAASALDREGG